MSNVPIGTENHPDAPWNEPLNVEYKRFVSVSISYYETLSLPPNLPEEEVQKAFRQKVYDGEIPEAYDIDECFVLNN